MAQQTQTERILTGSCIPQDDIQWEQALALSRIADALGAIAKQAEERPINTPEKPTRSI